MNEEDCKKCDHCEQVLGESVIFLMWLFVFANVDGEKIDEEF